MRNKKRLKRTSTVSSNPATSNAALNLMAELARLAPAQVAQNVMPIFTFMGTNVMQRDDAQSTRIVDKVDVYLQCRFGHCADASSARLDYPNNSTCTGISAPTTVSIEGTDASRHGRSPARIRGRSYSCAPPSPLTVRELQINDMHTRSLLRFPSLSVSSFASSRFLDLKTSWRPCAH